MGRKRRIIKTGAIYHIINRGNNKKFIFKRKEDKDGFIECLKKAKSKYEYNLFAYAIMNNHYHLLLQSTESGTISQIMHHIHCGYSRYYKKIYENIGHVFQGRYKSMLIDSEPYLLQVSKYIHLNPYRAGIVNSPENYKYSSFKHILEGQENDLIEKDFILNIISKDTEGSKFIYRNMILDDMENSKEDEKLEY